MLRPGTDTGSAMNALYSRMTKGQPEPQVGMGATILCWSDRQAATIVSVEGKPGRWVVGVQGDRAELIGGSMCSEDQQYRYSPNPKARVIFFRFDAAKGWRRVEKAESGRWVLLAGEGLRVGERREYRDPSF